MNKIKRYIREYYWVPILFLLLYNVFFFLPEMENRAIQGKAIVGEIIEINRKSVIFSYCFNEEKFEELTGRGEIPNVITKYLRNKEKFMVTVDSIRPSNAMILLYQPVIDSTYIHTNSITISQLGDHLISFTYEALERTYERKQVVKRKFSGLKNRYYDVMYKKDNPLIAYVCVDSTNCYNTRKSISSFCESQ